MPDLIMSRKFLQDLDRLKSRKQIILKVAKTLARLEADPSHIGLHIERIKNDQTNGQNSIPFLAFSPWSRKGCFISFISVTRSAIAMSSSGAFLPVTTM